MLTGQNSLRFAIYVLRTFEQCTPNLVLRTTTEFLIPDITDIIYAVASLKQLSLNVKLSFKIKKNDDQRTIFIPRHPC